MAPRGRVLLGLIFLGIQCSSWAFGFCRSNLGAIVGRSNCQLDLSSSVPRCLRTQLLALPCPEGVDPKLWKALSKQKRENMMAMIEADNGEADGEGLTTEGAQTSQPRLGETTDLLPSWSKADGTIDSTQVPAGFRAGFVSIVGYPNAGKSTLMNKLLGENLSIATAKAQTTRHRIMGVATGPAFQLVYSDTPGVVQPKYRLHASMMRSVKAAVSDADVLLAVVDATEPPPQSLSSITAAIGNGAGAGGNLARSGIALDDVVEANENGLDREDVGLNEDMVAAEAAAAAGMSELGGVSRSGYGSEEAKDDDFFLKVLSTAHQPIVLALNKVDALSGSEVSAIEGRWRDLVPRALILPVSALTGDNTEALLPALTELLPESLPLYHADTITDKPEKFFASEIIRENIFNLYGKEVPFSCEVLVTAFKDTPKLLKIMSTIMVSRDSQKGIVIGAKGAAIKRLSTESRESLEKFFGKKVFLETKVAVNKDWRSSDDALKKFGYGE